MKQLSLWFSLTCWAISVGAQAENYPKVWFAGGNICIDEPWQLVFSDDFDGDSLDRAYELEFAAILGKRGTTEVRVKDDAGCVDDRPQSRFTVVK